jgi:hypothetical protein
MSTLWAWLGLLLFCVNITWSIVSIEGLFCDVPYGSIYVSVLLTVTSSMLIGMMVGLVIGLASEDSDRAEREPLLLGKAGYGATCAC